MPNIACPFAPRARQLISDIMPTGNYIFASGRAPAMFFLGRGLKKARSDLLSPGTAAYISLSMFSSADIAELILVRRNKFQLDSRSTLLKLSNQQDPHQNGRRPTASRVCATDARRGMQGDLKSSISS
eukprot:GEZU01006762.1.p4 GENE.GEZU01006762.1~~GEZU01006762.1.p4  ORF type:complete len:128 (-),score=1.52 GEZU01006762.1:540-923(-)